MTEAPESMSRDIQLPDVSKLSVEDQIAFWRKMSEDADVTGNVRISAYEHLVELIGERTQNTVRYVIELVPYKEGK